MEDSDCDGLTDYEEYLKRTNPLKPEIKINLSKGLNFFGYPVDVPVGYTSYGLIRDLGEKDEVHKIQRYDLNTKTYITTSYNPLGDPVGVDFTIVNGEGYIVYMNLDKSIDFSGSIISSDVLNINIYLGKGLNIISLQCVSRGYTSYDLLAYLGSPDEVTFITRLNKEMNICETTTYFFGKPSGIEFKIMNGEAYIVYMKEAKILSVLTKKQYP